MTTDGKFSLTYKGQTTIWPIESASIWSRKSRRVGLLRRLLQSPDEVVINVGARLPPIQGGQEFESRPDVVLSWLMTPFSMEALENGVIFIPKAYDSRVRDHVATLYYHKHNDVDDVSIRFHERDGDQFRIEISGLAHSPWPADADKNIAVAIECWVTKTER